MAHEFANLAELNEAPAFGPGIKEPDRLEWLRTETEMPFRIDLWDTGEYRPDGKPQLAYRLCLFHNDRAGDLAAVRAKERGADEPTGEDVDPHNDRVWEVVFAGEELGASPLYSIDGDEMLAALIGFLSARPGDVEAEYFDNYTERQLAFADEHGETLALWGSELEEQAAKLREG